MLQRVRMASVIGLAVLVLARPSSAAPAAAGRAAAEPRVRAASRELVVTHPFLALSGDRLPAQLEGFLRRVEVVVGWPTGSLRGKAFVDPAEAVRYVREQRPAFAVLPLREYVQAHAPSRLTVLGSVTLLEETQRHITTRLYRGLARADAGINEHVHLRPGLRLAMEEGGDLRWVALLFDGTLQPSRHFVLQPMTSDSEAVAAVEQGRADLAMIGDVAYEQARSRLTSAHGPLKLVFSTPEIPPAALVATGSAKAADRAALAAALDRICRGDGLNDCTRLGLFVLEKADPQVYEGWAWKYEHYPP